MTTRTFSLKGPGLGDFALGVRREVKVDKPLLELPDQVLQPKWQEVRGLREVAMVLDGSCRFVVNMFIDERPKNVGQVEIF